MSDGRNKKNGLGHHPPLRRATAIVLSWILSAGSVSAVAPPNVVPAPTGVGRPASSAPFTPATGPGPRAASKATTPGLLTQTIAPQEGNLGGGSPNRREEGTREEERSDGGDDGTCEPADGEGAGEHQETGASPSTPPGGFVFFGPQKYVRTRGSRNVYTTTLNVPPWVVAPYDLHVQNGEADGTHRLTAAWIQVNGVCVATPRDFRGRGEDGDDKAVASFDRTVTLTPQTILKVTLASEPGSYLYLTLSGQNADHTPPRVTVAQPAPGSTIGTATPRIDVQYQDLLGVGEPVASGVDVSTLQVLLDGVDRTSLFTVRSSDASWDVPSGLALSEGVHAVTASIKDRAGNLGTTTASFSVDLTPPQIQILAPAAGAYLNTATPLVQIQYQDSFALDLSSFKVLVNGTDQTAAFTKTAGGATGTPSLPTGGNLIVAQIKDLAGNASSAQVSFIVDTQPPTLSFVHPAAASYVSTSTVTVSLQYADDQALDLTSLKVLLDSSPVIMGIPGPSGATGSVGPLADGPHSLSASIADRAGNRTTAGASFVVDTTPPAIAVTRPLPGSILNSTNTGASVTFSDADGVVLSSFKATLNGADVTSSFTAMPGSASGALSGLPQGPNTLQAQISDVAGNVGTARSTFTVDSVPPTGTIVAPQPLVGTALPIIQATYADPAPGTGVNPGSVQVFVDGALQGGNFTASPSAVVGTPASPLAEGAHTVLVTFADGAGNPGQAGPTTFTVDTQPPTAAFRSPANDSFLNNPTPTIELDYSDATSGVATASVHLYLQPPPTPSGPSAEVEITSYLQVGPTSAVGSIPASAPLADGSYRLRAVLSDLAQNAAPPVVIQFEIDTTPPQIAIAQPVGGSYTNAFTTTVSGPVSDDTPVTVLVEGIAASVSAGIFTAPAVPLGAGPLVTLHATATDSAGNTQTATVTLNVDRMPPTVQIRSPASGAYVKGPAVPVTGTVTAAAPLAQVIVNGTPVPIAGGAFSALVTSPDGPLTIVANAQDAAGNVGTALVGVIVDSIPPVVTITSPPERTITNAASLHITGTVTDASPVTLQYAGSLLPLAGNAFAFDVPLPSSDGVTALTFTATDAAGNVGTATLHVTVDRTPPALTIAAPAEGAYVGRFPVLLQGAVQDLTATTVVVDGVAATVAQGSWQAQVAALPEGTHAFSVVATDAAGNQATQVRNIIVDTTPPAIAITQPLGGSYTNAQTTTVTGTVSDDTPVTVQVEGLAASVSGGAFTASSVPLGSGPQVTLHATAADAAGNTQTATVTLNVDRTPPTVQITSPLAGAYLRGPVLTVSGMVTAGAPVTLDVNGQPATLSGNSFTALVPVTDGSVTLLGTARDAAGNVGTAQIIVNVDSVPPVIAVSLPADGSFTNRATAHLVGTVTDASPTTLTIGGTPVGLSGTAFAQDVGLPPTDGPTTITLIAQDAAGNVATFVLHVTVDRTPPTLQIASPAEGAILGAVPVVVQGLVQDASPTTVTVDGIPATLTQQAWQASFPGLGQGPHSFSVVATDAAGNQTSLVRNVFIDLLPVTIAITSPAPGALTNATSMPVTGIVQAGSAVSVLVNGIPAAVSAAGQFSAVVPLVEGNNTLQAVGTSASGRSASASVVVTRDTTPPIITLSAPSTLSFNQTVQVTARVMDDTGVAQVVLKLNGAVLGSFTAPPYAAPLTVPKGAKGGDLLTLEADATDLAGNSASVTQTVKVIGNGVIVGQVLSDATGLPLPGATVQMVSGGSSVQATTDETGRYSLPTSSPEAVLVAGSSGMTSVVRDIPVQAGVGTLPVDARLTPLAPPVTIPAAGGSVAAGPVTLTVPPGPGAVTLTPLSPQGLPGLLPMGYSPLVAFDLRTDTGAGAPLSAAITGLTQDVLNLAVYRPDVHTWLMVTPNLHAATDGSLTVSLPEINPYAIVAADPDPALVIPGASQPLTGLAPLDVPPTSVATTVVTPPTIPPTGGTAQVALAVQSPTPLPSGTVVQAQVTETFTLATGEAASEETRLEDIVLFQKPAPSGAVLAATLPATPSRTFSDTELTVGHVHLDIVAGREGVRGSTGGSQPVTIQATGAQLVVPGGALAQDTAIALEPQASLSSFLPSASGLQPLAEVVVDTSGATLALPAQLSVTSPGGVASGDNLLIARVDRVLDIPRLVVVGLGQLNGSEIVTQAYPGLPGITVGGRYVFYRVGSPLGFVAGLTTSSGALVPSVVVGTDQLPFIGLSGADGSYIVAALAGPVQLTATVPRTSLLGTATAAVSAGQTAAQNIALAGTVTTATVSPADGSTGVDTGVEVQITSSAPLNPTTVTPASIMLLKGTQAVSARLVLSGSGKTLAVIPAAALDFSATYTLQASGLADVFGGLVSVPAVSFRTRDNVPPVYNTGALTFSFPDASGLVTISAPAQTFAPGTTILIIDSGNGIVLSLTAGNSGEVAAHQMPASINDQMMVTITDPFGNVTTFNRSQFVDPATGKTAIGAGGGVVQAADGSGVELRIPEGALDKAVTLRITAFGPDLFPDRPDLGGANFGSGIKIESADQPVFKKEVKLAFPLPDFTTVPPDQQPAQPQDAFYYVYRKIDRPDGKVAFQTLDWATVEGSGPTAKVVMASYPMSGYVDSIGQYVPATGAALGVGLAYAICVWTVNRLLPGTPVGGVITGSVLRPFFPPGSTAPSYQGVPGLVVRATTLNGTSFDPTKAETVAITQADGRYTMFDDHFTGGVVEVHTVDPNDGLDHMGTVYAVQATDSKIDTDPGLAHLKLFGLFKNLATADILLPAVAAKAPPPPFAIHVMTEDASGRHDVTGLIVAGTPLRIGFRSVDAQGNLAIVNSATINGATKTVVPESVPPAVLPMNFLLQDDASSDGRFTPSQAGSYTIAASAISPFGGVENATYTFRVIAAGGSVGATPGVPPAVIDAQTVPANGAAGVPVGVFPAVFFTEPVKHIPGSVKLVAPDGTEVPCNITGIGLDASGNPIPVLVTGQDVVVTSVTLEPLSGLEFNAAYTIRVTDGVIDLATDAQGQPAPLKLSPAPYQSTFTTFGPEAVGGSGAYQVAGLAVLGDRAYVARTLYPGGVTGAQSGELHIFDTADPVAPLEVLDPPTRFNYPPRDLAAGLDGNGTRTVVIAASPRTYFTTNGEIVVYTELVSTPANLFVYDVSTDQPQWVGAASLTSNILDGYPNRVVLRGNSVYVATARKGIQVVDLTGTRAGFPDAGFGTANPDPAQASAMVPINQSLFNSGINQSAVVTIPLDPDPSKNAILNVNDLKVMDFVVNGQSQPLVFATGNMPQIGLVVASPTNAQVLLSQQIQNVQGSLNWGTAIALGHFADKDVALVGGYGTLTGSGSVPVLAVVDISNPTVPVVLNILPLSGLTSVGDVLVKDNTVLVSGGLNSGLALLFDLTQPASPEFVGTLAGVASRLAITDKNILFSADRTFLAGNATPLSGLRTAALATTAVIYQITPSGMVRNQGILVTEKDVKINFGVVPSSYQIGTAQVEIYRNGGLIQTLAATTSGSKGTATWPAGAVVDPKAVYTARAVIEPQTDKVLQSAFKTIPLVRIVFVDKRGEESFAPLTSDPRPVVTLDPVAASDVTLIGDGTQAQVRVSGQITDALADIVDSHAADITQVFVGDQTYPVTPVPEPASVTRPFAFRATFQTTVTVGISDGSNTVSVEAENAIGNRGYGSFTINAQQSGPLPATAPTGSAYDTKFLDPFTLVASAMSTTVPNSLVLYHGATSPTGSETPLVETGVGTLTFTGVTPDLGTASLSLQAPVSGDTSARRVVPAVLSSLGLSIVKQSYEFLETAPGSGLFRNPALRLPSSDTMEVLLAGPLDPSVIDTIRVNVRSALDQDAVTLTETAPASQTFTGSTPVPGLGTTTIQVASILSQPGQPSRLRLLLDSSDLSLQGFYMELLEEQPGNNRFKSQSFGPTSTVFTPNTAVQTAFVSVQNNPPLDGGTFEPAWVVASGLATLQSGDQAMINGQAFDLTLAPSPAATSGPLSGVRARLPLVVVPDKGGSQAPNILTGLQGQNPPVSRPYTFTFNSGGVSITRPSGSIVLSPAVVVRGSQVTLTTSYITAGGGEPEVKGMSVSGTGVTTTLVQRQEQPVSLEVVRVTTTFSMTVDRTATVGLRDLTFTLDNGQTKTFPQALKVSRGRMVIFAIDGFGHDFFTQVKEDPGPAVNPKKGLGTALAVIFGDTYRGTGLLEKKPLLTSFPPITFSRWSTMFSGSFPSVTGVPANEWLNRTTLPVPGGNLGGNLSQCLGCGDPSLAQWVNGASDAYNRHFLGTRFIYDDLRDQGFRSIVLGQQAGLGMGNSGPHGDDIWETFGVTDFAHFHNPFNAFNGARDLDEGSTKRAIGEIHKQGDSFDLMVVYLPGLDHYLHGYGVSAGTAGGGGSTGSLNQAQYFFASGLHDRLNRITQALEQSFGQTTVYGVFGDHSLVDTTPAKFMYLTKQGSFLQNNGFKTWQRTLQVNGDTLIGDTLVTGVFRSSVIFDAQYGLAYVYVASNAPVAGNPPTLRPDFSRPPSLDVLEPFVDQIYENYIAAAGTSWSNRPISDILVRVPGTAGFSDSSYMVVPRDYKLSGTFACGASGTDECRLANQLRPPSYLLGKGYGDPPDARWQYALPTERLARLNSPNSGDIVVLANMSTGFHFDSDQGIPGNHGSLAFADAVVPVAFGYPGGDALPDVLKPIVTYLESLSPTGYSTASGDGAVWDGVTEAEATAIRRFFLSP
jgi:hypothetical protein